MNATTNRRAAGIKLAATGAILLFSVYAFAILLSVPAAVASPYGKQATSTADGTAAVQAVEDACAPYFEAIDEVKRVEGLTEVEDEAGVWLVPSRDADAVAYASLEDAAAESAKFVANGKVRVGSTIYIWVSTTALSRGDVSTDALTIRFALGDYSVRDDGFLIDGDGYVVCTATFPFHSKGDVIETPVGAAKVYDIMRGLNKVACYAEETALD